MGRQDRKKYSGGFFRKGVLLYSRDDQAIDNTGLLGIGHRAAEDMRQENAKTGYYGFFGAKHISGKAREAQDKALKKKGWFVADSKSDRNMGSYDSPSGWRKVPGKKGVFTPGKKSVKPTKKKGWWSLWDDTQSQFPIRRKESN